MTSAITDFNGPWDVHAGVAKAATKLVYAASRCLIAPPPGSRRREPRLDQLTVAVGKSFERGWDGLVFLFEPSVVRLRMGQEIQGRRKLGQEGASDGHSA